MLLCLIAPSQAWALVNLIPNGGFERVSPDGVPLDWTHDYGDDSARVDSIVKEGRFALELNDDSASSAEGLTSAHVPIAAGTRYTATADVYSSAYGARLYLKFYDDEGVEVESGSVSPSVTAAWERVQITRQAPPRAVTAALLCYFLQPEIGTAYFDDATLTRASSAPLLDNPGFEVGLVANPGFEGSTDGNGLPLHWSRAYNSGGAAPVRSNEQAHEGYFSLKLTDSSTGNAEGVESDGFPASPGVGYTAHAWVHKSGNSPSIYLRFYNASGTLLSSSWAAGTQPGGAWQKITVEATAPANTASVKVLCYSGSTGTGTYYFDRIFLETTTGFPLHWYDWSTGGDVRITSSPTSAVGTVMRLTDTSTTTTADAATSVAAEPGVKYRLSADLYLLAGSTEGSIHLKFYDRNDMLLSTQGAYETTTGQWQNRQITATAPWGTARAEIVAYISTVGIGTVWFDSLVLEPLQVTRYVSPTGTGTGISAGSPASITSSSFWTGVTSTLATDAVLVKFLAGEYVDRLSFNGMGNLTHLLTLEGAEPFGSVFTNWVDEGCGDCNVLSLTNSKNITIRNLHFTGEGHTAQVINLFATGTGAATERISIDRCSFADLPNMKYSAIAPWASTSTNAEVREIAIENSDFIRTGYNASAHFIYSVFHASQLRIDHCYFQDSVGGYLKFGGERTYGASSGYEVYDSIFRVDHERGVTGNGYIEIDALGVEGWCDDGVQDCSWEVGWCPGEPEPLPKRLTYFPSDFIISGNTFVGAAHSNWVTFFFRHDGYTPPNKQHLLSSTQKTTLQEGTLSNRLALLSQCCDLEFGEDPNFLQVDNQFVNGDLAGHFRSNNTKDSQANVDRRFPSACYYDAKGVVAASADITDLL